MPIYGYACKNCDNLLDALKKIADDQLLYCPECGEPQLKRQLSAPRFRLKGKGWYETDFKKNNQRNLAGEQDAAKLDKKGGDKADKKTEKKPDKKSETKSTSKSSPKSSDSKAGTA